jgi:acetyltransferase-like isoleucine patch superfamily enzyme
VKKRWIQFWMKYAGRGFYGRMATRLATWPAPPYYGRGYLAKLNPKGYIAPSAIIQHLELNMGKNVFIGDRVIVYQDKMGGVVQLGDRTHLYNDVVIQTGSGGGVTIGINSHIHPRCQLSAYKSDIIVGNEVQVAPNCGFYPYDHGVAMGKPIQEQPLHSKGPIVLGDDVWLGFGVIVLSGVHIGAGAVVGAGSVVSQDIPENGIATGSPAKVVRMRDNR